MCGIEDIELAIDFSVFDWENLCGHKSWYVPRSWKSNETCSQVPSETTSLLLILLNLQWRNLDSSLEIY